MMRMTKTIDHAQLMVKRDAWSYFVLDLEHAYEQQKCLATWSLNTGTIRNPAEQLGAFQCYTEPPKLPVSHAPSSCCRR